jgi:ferritin
MIIDEVLKEIRTLYTWDWKLSKQEAKKLIRDFVKEEVKEELKCCKKYHKCKEDIT